MGLLVTNPLGGGIFVQLGEAVFDDLTVEGTFTTQNNEVVEGTFTIDLTDPEAFLVRKDGDSGDIFTVDTNNDQAIVGNNSINNNYPLDIRSGGSSALIQFKSGGTEIGEFGGDAVFGTTDNNAVELQTNGSQRVRIDSSGNVGIGLTNPSGILEIEKGNSTNFRFGEGASDDTPSITVRNVDGGKAASLVAGQSGGAFVFDDSGNFNIQADTRSNIDNDTAGAGTNIIEVAGGADANSLYINDSGVTGIATSSPFSDSTLTVDGGITAGDGSTGSFSSGYSLQDSDSQNYTFAIVDSSQTLKFGGSHWDDFFFSTSSGSVMAFDSSQQFGINNDSPTELVDIDDTNGNSVVDIREGDTTVFYNGIDAGPIQAAEDTYQQLIDQNITDALSAGDQVGYTFAVDNNTVMQVSAEADGSGGIQKAKPKFEDVVNLTVQSSTPSNPEEGDVYIDDGSNTSSGDYALRVYNGTSWVDQN